MASSDIPQDRKKFCDINSWAIVSELPDDSIPTAMRKLTVKANGKVYGIQSFNVKSDIINDKMLDGEQINKLLNEGPNAILEHNVKWVNSFIETKPNINKFKYAPKLHKYGVCVINWNDINKWNILSFVSDFCMMKLVDFCNQYRNRLGKEWYQTLFTKLIAIFDTLKKASLVYNLPYNLEGVMINYDLNTLEVIEIYLVNYLAYQTMEKYFELLPDEIQNGINTAVEKRIREEGRELTKNEKDTIANDTTYDLYKVNAFYRWFFITIPELNMLFLSQQSVLDFNLSDYPKTVINIYPDNIDKSIKNLCQIPAWSAIGKELGRGINGFVKEVKPNSNKDKEYALKVAYVTNNTILKEFRNGIKYIKKLEEINAKGKKYHFLPALIGYKECRLSQPSGAIIALSLYNSYHNNLKGFLNTGENKNLVTPEWWKNLIVKLLILLSELQELRLVHDDLHEGNIMVLNNDMNNPTLIVIDYEKMSEMTRHDYDFRDFIRVIGTLNRLKDRYLSDDFDFIPIHNTIDELVKFDKLLQDEARGKINANLLNITPKNIVSYFGLKLDKEP